MKNFISLLAAAGCYSLAGCGGGAHDVSITTNSNQQGDSGSGGVHYFCNTIEGVGAHSTSSVDPGCSGCTVTDAPLASDDDAHSYGDITVPMSTPYQGAAILASAPSGTLYRAGSVASAFVTESNGAASGVDASFVITITTYSGGLMQEQSSSGLNISLGNANSLNRRDLGTSGDPTLPHSFYWFTTTLPFDAVQIGVSAPGVHTGDTPELKVYGLCSDGGGG